MNFLKSLMRKHRLSAYKVYFVSIILFAIMYYLSDLYRIDILNYKPKYQYTYIDYLLFSLITATTVGAAGIKTIELDTTNKLFTYVYVCQLVTIILFIL